MPVREILERIRSRLNSDEEAAALLDAILSNKGCPAEGIQSLVDEIDLAING